jgi:hypothetical protein
MKGHIAFILIIVITFFIAAAGVAHGAESTAVLKVGTFDSRAVALAFWRSAEGMEKTGTLHREMKEAKEKGDEERVKELEIEGPGLQVRLHQQVFSTGSVTDVIQRIEDKLPAIAAEAGVVIIVPKWNVAWQGDGVEVVDLTEQLVKCLNTDKQILKMIGQMSDQEPVPIEELSMNPMD